MRHPLHPLGLALVSAVALATTACSPAPSKDAPDEATEVVSAPGDSPAETGTGPTAQTMPELIRALAAAPEGLSLLTADGARLFSSVYGPDDCAWLGPDSEGPELPFNRYCVWPRHPDGGGRPEVLTGIVADRIVSVAVIGRRGALPGWDCTPASTAPNTELCVAVGTSSVQKTEWNTAWNNFVTVFVSRP